MRISLQTLILSIALPAIAVASTFEYGNSQGEERFDLHNKPGSDLQTPRQQATGAPNFVRLVLMRLIYGIASTMGVEDRLEDAFNGAFVPPGEDSGLGLGDLGGEDDGDGLFGDVFGDDILF